jgi:hypothetical protein
MDFKQSGLSVHLRRLKKTSNLKVVIAWKVPHANAEDERAIRCGRLRSSKGMPYAAVCDQMWASVRKLIANPKKQTQKKIDNLRWKIYDGHCCLAYSTDNNLGSFGSTLRTIISVLSPSKASTSEIQDKLSECECKCDSKQVVGVQNDLAKEMKKSGFKVMAACKFKFNETPKAGSKKTSQKFAESMRKVHKKLPDFALKSGEKKFDSPSNPLPMFREVCEYKSSSEALFATMILNGMAKEYALDGKKVYLSSKIKSSAKAKISASAVNTFKTEAMSQEGSKDSLYKYSLNMGVLP